MKVITIRRCPGELQRILKAGRRQDVVLRPRQGEELLLSFIDDFDYEIAAQSAIRRSWRSWNSDSAGHARRKA